jgi:hypothetical protein
MSPETVIWVDPIEYRVRRFVISGDLLVANPWYLSPLWWPQKEPGMPKKGWGVYTVEAVEEEV